MHAKSFSHLVDELLSKPQQYKAQWVALVEAAITQKRHNGYGSYLLEQCFMQRWLGLE